MSEKIMNSITLDEIKELAETVRKNELGKIKIRCGDCEIVIEGKKSREIISSVSCTAGYDCSECQCLCTVRKF